MADNDRKTKDLWIGTQQNPATVIGGVTAGTKGTKGKFWLKLLVNQATIDQISSLFAAEIQESQKQVEIQRNAKLLEFGGPTVPDAQANANASCMYRNFFKPVIQNGQIVPDQFEISVSQSSIDYQIGKGFANLIKTKYYQVLEGKASLIGSADEPINPAIPQGSKVSVRLNTMVSASPNNAGFGLALSRMAQVFIYEWGTVFGGGTDSLPEGIELGEETAASALPDHVVAAMAKANTPKPAAQQPQQQYQQPQQQYQQPYQQPNAAGGNPYAPQTNTQPDGAQQPQQVYQQPAQQNNDPYNAPAQQQYQQQPQNTNAVDSANPYGAQPQQQQQPQQNDPQGNNANPYSAQVQQQQYQQPAAQQQQYQQPNVDPNAAANPYNQPTNQQPAQQTANVDPNNNPYPAQ